MTYDDVNLILEDGIIPEGYEDYYDNLNLMKELSDLLTKVKKEQGKIDFGISEISEAQDPDPTFGRRDFENRFQKQISACDISGNYAGWWHRHD